MTTRALRRLVVAVCVLGIAGMIAGSIADNNGTTITFGLVTVVGVVVLIAVTSVVSPTARPLDEAAAAELERRIAGLVEAGADEMLLRELVGNALRLGRRTGAAPRP